MSFAWAKPYEPKTDLGRWFDERLPLPRLVYNAVGGGYPVPRNLNYGWNFGVLAGIFLVIQIVTGIVLAMHYFASADGAFNSVEHIMRDVNARLDAALRPRQRRQLLLHRHLHPHLPRPLYGSYKAPRELVWMLGLVIYLLMMATAFMGYVLPWGQMSYWGAQVITGFFSALPAGRRADPHLAARRLRARPGGADPLLLAPLSAAVRDRRRGHPPHLGAAHPGLGQPDRRRREEREGHAALPSLLHRQGRLVRRLRS